MWTQEELSKRIRDALFLLDPEVSLEPGTPERKIIDAVSSIMAEIQVERFIQNYNFDLDTKFGYDLDDFLSIFGFARQAARRATGYVTFSRGTPAPAPILIPAGTQVSAPATSVTPQVTFATVTDAVIPENQTSTRVAIEAVVPGNIGNVSSGRITGILGDIGNVSSVINNGSTSGGTSEESDESFRLRFRNTVFRSIAGTTDQFLALALTSEKTNRALVLGPVSRYSEYIQVPSGGTVLSSNPHAKYVYNQNFFLTSDGNDYSIFYKPDVDFIWGVQSTVSEEKPEIVISNVINPKPGSAPAVSLSGSGNLVGTDLKWGYTYVYSLGGESSLSPASTGTALTGAQVIVNVGTAPGTTNAWGGTITDRNVYRYQEGNWGYVGNIGGVAGTVFTDNVIGIGAEPPTNDLSVDAIAYLEHEYISKNSRNFIQPGGYEVLNKIDVFISGADPQDASDVVTGPGISFNNDVNSKYYYGNYRRGYGTTNPAVNNKFIQLMWTPVSSLPSELTINGVTYVYETDFWLCKDITNLRDSARARDGIELSAAMGSAINVTNFPVNYTFDRLPILTNDLIDEHKQTGQDVLVHTASFKYFKINFVAIYKNGFTKSNVDQEVQSLLTRYFEAQKFGAYIQAGDILQIAYQAPGIDTIRYAGTADNATYYGIQEVDPTVSGTARILITHNPNTDFVLGDIELPVFNELGPNVDNSPIQKTQNSWTS